MGAANIQTITASFPLPHAVPLTGSLLPPVDLSSSGLPCLPQCGNAPYIANVQELTTKVHCGEEFRTDVGRSFIPPTSGCPSPWPKVPPPHSTKAGICNGHKDSLHGRAPQCSQREKYSGKGSEAGSRQAVPGQSPQASGSMSPAEETGVGLAMRPVALMSRSALPCNIMALSRWVLSISLLLPLVCSQKQPE